MPIGFAMLAGALATLNPCGFAMLAAFLSYYVGADEEVLPRSATRAMQGVLVGLLVAAGFLTVFAVLGMPVVLGLGQIATAVPWIGLGIGIVMTGVAGATLAGRSLSLTVRRPRGDTRHRRASAMYLFGMGYGLASLGCTMPVFLVVIGASLATSTPLASVVVFLSYAAGMALVLMALATSAALLRDGIASSLKRALPHMRWLNGGLLLVASGYLVYYWGSVLFRSPASVASDRLIGTADTVTATVSGWISSGGGRWVLLAAAVAVAITVITALRQWARTDRGATLFARIA
jgi:cytochrome c biogenesis protein CcdA